jgi:serine protease Do
MSHLSSDTLKDSLRRNALLAALIASIAVTPIFASTAADGVARAATNASQAQSDARSLSTAFRGAARTLAPSVVTINTKSRATAPAQMQMSPQMMDPRLMDPRMMDPRGMPQMQAPPQQEARGTGTGAVISRDGYIVTANHVVADAEEIEIVFSDGRTARATVVGLDPGTDIAVLHTDAKDLVPAVFGESAALDVGDWVVAIGAPFGLEHTVTAGIVSAKGRSDVGMATFENYIQTDAAINPGNSGGPLANLDGEIIGINSSISSKSGGNDGIGFAVPSAVARRVVESIIADGRVKRGWLGVSVQPIDHELATSLGANSNNGVIVSSVAHGSPADHAGLEAGDLILGIAGQKVRSPGELLASIGESKPGAAIEIVSMRDGRERTINATLTERKDANSSAFEQQYNKPTSHLSVLGIELEELTAADAANLGMTAEDGALVVGRVEEEGRACRSGIKPGDVIRRIGKRPVHTLDEINAALDAFREGASIPALVERDGRARFLLIRPAKQPSDTKSRAK